MDDLKRSNTGQRSRAVAAFKQQRLELQLTYCYQLTKQSKRSPVHQLPAHGLIHTVEWRSSVHLLVTWCREPQFSSSIVTKLLKQQTPIGHAC